MRTTYGYFQTRCASLSRKALLVNALVLVLLGFAGGWITGAVLYPQAGTSAGGREIRLGGYRFINPLLDCEAAGDLVEFRELRPFQDKVERLVRERTAEYRLSHVAVYFRDLMNGPWFGINEKELFTPASLLKVPIMIACLKQAEQDPSFLKRAVVNTLTEDQNTKQLIRPAEILFPGKSYTVEELIRRSIQYSDNNAAYLLGKSVQERILLQTFQHLGVSRPRMTIQYNFISVKMYATFFRVLFNASYLNRKMSQKALEYLALANYRDGLVAGVPGHVLVAQKFGEYAENGSDGVKQMHNCGIVYYPGRPYLLCVMSRGADFKTLDDIIRDISRTVYDEVERQSADTVHKARL